MGLDEAVKNTLLTPLVMDEYLQDYSMEILK